MTKDADREEAQPVEKETLKDLEATDEDEVKGGTHPTHLGGCISMNKPPEIITHSD